VDLVSITTNGADNQILKGMPNTLMKVKYLSLIGNLELFPSLGEFGYREIGGDDRGYTFAREAAI